MNYPMTILQMKKLRLRDFSKGQSSLITGGGQTLHQLVTSLLCLVFFICNIEMSSYLKGVAGFKRNNTWVFIRNPDMLLVVINGSCFN